MFNRSRFEKGANHAKALRAYLCERRSGARQIPLKKDGASSKPQISKEDLTRATRLAVFVGNLRAAGSAVISGAAMSARQVGFLV